MSSNRPCVAVTGAPGLRDRLSPGSGSRDSRTGARRAGLGVLGYAVLSLTIVRMLPVALALLGTGARRPTLASSVGSGRVASRRSSSPSS